MECGQVKSLKPLISLNDGMLPKDWTCAIGALGTTIEVVTVTAPGNVDLRDADPP